MNKYEKHLLYTNDETIDKNYLDRGIFNTAMLSKCILDICLIDNDISILFLENDNSNKIKQIVFETDKY